MAQSLIEAFLSSLVRQVGRDSGKVISNSIYKDAHATPIRHVSSKTETDKKKERKAEATKTTAKASTEAVNFETHKRMREITHSVLGDLLKTPNSTDSTKTKE